MIVLPGVGGHVSHRSLILGNALEGFTTNAIV